MWAKPPTKQKLAHAKQTNSIKLAMVSLRQMLILKQMNSNISQETSRASLGSKENEKVKTAKGKHSKSCLINQVTIPIGSMFISCIIINSQAKEVKAWQEIAQRSQQNDLHQKSTQTFSKITR